MAERDRAASAADVEAGADARAEAEVDICLLVEGTYPFVPGGVSSWVHDIILGHPDLKFSVVNIGSYPDAYGAPRFEMPKNAVALHRVFCQEGRAMALDGRARVRRICSVSSARAPTRVPASRACWPHSGASTSRRMRAPR